MPQPAGIRLRSVAPAFLVADVNATAEWYGSHLGFTTAGIFPRTPPASWASLVRDGVEIMLQRATGDRAANAASRGKHEHWDAYVRMNGVHAFYETLSNQPFVRMPLTRQPYGDWEFEIADPNGYVLVFGGDESLERPPSRS